jgi:hypothetical protein
MKEKEIYSNLAEKYNKPDVSPLLKEDLEINPSYPKLNNFGGEYTLKNKLDIWRKYLGSWEDELNYPLFNHLSTLRITSFDNSKLVDGKDYYSGAISFDLDILENSIDQSDIDIDSLKSFINPSQDITYEKALSLVSQDPNTLISAMTLLENNYNYEVDKKKDDNPGTTYSNFIFTESRV